jgi:molybdopterin-guanine dinucleotide biosynthesis protein A
VSSREISALITAFANTGGPVVFAQTEDSESHPLCAIVHTDLLGRISTALDRDECGVHDLWLRLEGTAVAFDNPNAFVNINCPDDLDAWLAGSPHGKHQSINLL